MPTLHVRDIPDELYALIKQMADQRKQSLSAQVISLLQDSIGRVAAQADTQKVPANPETNLTKLPPGGPSSIKRLREGLARKH